MKPPRSITPTAAGFRRARDLVEPLLRSEQEIQRALQRIATTAAGLAALPAASLNEALRAHRDDVDILIAVTDKQR